MRPSTRAVIVIAGALLLGVGLAGAQSAPVAPPVRSPAQDDQPAITEQPAESRPTTTPERETAAPDEGRIEDRGVPVKPLLGVPPTATAPLKLVGPTENLTKVINTLTHKHKSLTTVITTAPGLQLTQPVEISILFISPWGTNTRLTQPYQNKFGNRFVYNDPEGEGKLRHLRMDIWLTEPKPDGGHYSYSMTWQADLDPLYDITVSPLMFTLVSDCDTVPLVGTPLGNSEIRFHWADPAISDGWYNLSFNTVKGRPVSINQFAWSRTELSASAVASMNLHLPAILWKEHDPHLGVEYGGLPTFSKVPLPATTQDFQFALFPGQLYPGPEEIRGNTCIARLQYRITRILRTYSTL